MNIYGQTFKSLRKEKGLTLKEVSNRICSFVALSRWENGQNNMGFDKVIQLLKRIEITPSEFVFITQENKSIFPKEIVNAINKDHLSVLKNYTLKMITQFHSSQNKEDLFLAATSANYYYTDTDENLLPIIDRKKLVDILEDTAFWGQDDLLLFGNIVFLLSNQMAYRLASHIFKTFNFETQNSDILTFYAAISAFLSTVIKLLSDGEIALAKQLLQTIDQVKMDSYSLYPQLAKVFLIALANKETQKAMSIINFLIEIDMTSTADSFLQIYKKVIN